nr:U4/U6.U5 small nuclear ribonucleoprotein 27 kDa protein [Dromaius novaehollandiae]
MSAAGSPEPVASPPGAEPRYFERFSADDPEYLRARNMAADLRQDFNMMEQKKRVTMILQSPSFREELESLIQEQMKKGNNSSNIWALRQIADFMASTSPAIFPTSPMGPAAVTPINDLHGAGEGLPLARGERLLRCKVGGLCRLLDLYGWARLGDSHVTVRPAAACGWPLAPPVPAGSNRRGGDAPGRPVAIPAGPALPAAPAGTVPAVPAAPAVAVPAIPMVPVALASTIPVVPVVPAAPAVAVPVILVIPMVPEVPATLASMIPAVPAALAVTVPAVSAIPMVPAVPAAPAVAVSMVPAVPAAPAGTIPAVPTVPAAVASAVPVVPVIPVALAVSTESHLAAAAEPRGEAAAEPEPPNPFRQLTDRELEEYKREVERKALAPPARLSAASPLSPPRAERRRSRSASRERERRRRERSRSRERDRRRSRSRSPHRRRSRSPRRHRSSSSSPPRLKERRDEEKKEIKDSKGKERQITEEDLQGKTEEEIEMMKMMGFASFDTTKGKKVDGAANAYAINVSQKRKYRQYMNRKGGFNRPLDFIA